MRKTLLAGLLVLIPAYLTFYILRSVVLTFDEILMQLPATWLPPQSWQFPGMGLIATFLVVMLAGLLARNFFGAYLVRGLENLIQKIPVVKSVYGLFRQVAEVLFGDKKSGFKRVVLVQWSREGVWTLALVASDLEGTVLKSLQTGKTIEANDRYLNLFVPATPNPTSGFYFIARESEVLPVNISVEQALKTIISAGAIPPLEGV